MSPSHSPCCVLDFSLFLLFDPILRQYDTPRKLSLWGVYLFITYFIILMCA